MTTKTIKKPQCSAKVFSRATNFDKHQCLNMARIQIAGRWYCRLHNPDKASARARRLLVESITEGLSIEELQALTPALLRAAPDMYKALKGIWAMTAPKCHDSYIKSINDLCGKALATAEGKI